MRNVREYALFGQKHIEGCPMIGACGQLSVWEMIYDLGSGGPQRARQSSSSR